MEAGGAATGQVGEGAGAGGGEVEPGRRTAEVEDTPRVQMHDGRTLRRAFRVLRVRWLEQVSDTELIYYVAPRDGAP